MVKAVDIAASLQQKGFALLDADLLSEIKELKSFIEQNYPIASNDFYYSLIANTFDGNLHIKSRFHEILMSFYDRYFEKYKSRNESFLSKPGQTNAELLLHQDWNYTDEALYSVYNLWIPLTDVNKNNGAMFFLPGSHLTLGNLRSATLPTARIASDSFGSDDIEIVEVRAGQALVFHPAVFHGSFPNTSCDHRTIITSTIFDQEAPFYYYQKSEVDDQVKVFSIEDDAFMKGLHELSLGADPAGMVSATVPYTHHDVTAKLLKERLSQKKMKVV